jgi:cell cycle related kinase
MEDYAVLGRVGEGAHGVVVRARHRRSGRVVALKRILLKRNEDSIPETAIREIKALQVSSFVLRS